VVLGLVVVQKATMRLGRVTVPKKKRTTGGGLPRRFVGQIAWKLRVRNSRVLIKRSISARAGVALHCLLVPLRALRALPTSS